MKRCVLGLIALALAALVFSGCASVPAKASSDESLVVIKTEFINPDNQPRGFERSFLFSGGYPPSVVGQYSWDFNIVVIREPGVLLQSIGSSIQAGFHGEGGENAINLPLPYEAGQLVIADFVFVHKVEKTGQHELTSTMSFRRIENQEKADLMNSFKDDGRFSSWFK
jgi:hypothetical protein